jgi:hypothetical protein
MLLYDWKKVYDVTQGSAVEIVRVMKMLAHNEMPKNRYDKIYKYYTIDFTGDCFLLHPEVLLYNRYKYSAKDVAMYIAISALRPVADYMAYGKITLDLLYVPALIASYLINNENSLLRVENNEVHFLYEEVPNKKEIH